MYAGGRCHLWTKCHYDSISLICIDKRLESIGQKGTLQYWWKSYEGGYIKKDLQLLGSDSDVLKMARVGSESTEILLYVKRVSVLQVQRLIKEMEEIENRRGCVIEELDDDVNVVGEAISEVSMMMGIWYFLRMKKMKRMLTFLVEQVLGITFQVTLICQSMKGMRVRRTSE
ncbi:hypothetical protein M5689_012779 [Euphorbia peplus]|nr:hypothetical protein M5689_012779 [Euphorbia peplus]